MANQRIDQLNAETTPAAADVLPIYSVAGSDTKKITVKNLVQQGAALVDDASIPVAKVNLSGISGTNLSAGTVTAAKLDTSTIPATGGVTVSSSNLQLVAPTSPIVRNAGTGSLEHATSGATAGTYTKVTVDTRGHVTVGANLVGADVPVATSSVIGGVSIPAAGGLALTGGGALSHSNAVAGGASTRSGITYDLQGHIVSTVALVAADLPIATNAVKGAVIAGTGLAIDGNGIVSTSVATTSALGAIKIGDEFGLNGSSQLILATQGSVAGGTAYPKVTVNSKGVVTAGASLTSADIPALDTAKITSGTFNVDRYGANTITGAKLANYATGKISEAFPTADYISQLFFNPLDRTLYMWDGNVYQPIGVSYGQVVFSGTYDAGTNLITSVTTEGAAIGLTVGGALTSPVTANKSHYVVVDQPGTGTAPAPTIALSPPDMLLSNGTTWILLDVSDTVTAQLASNIQVSPAGNIASTNVQSALQELDDEKLPLAGGTLTGNLALNTGIAIVYEGATTDNFETTLYVVDPTADRTILLPNVSGTVITTGDTGTVTSTMLLDGTILNADINASAAIADTKLDTIATALKVSNSATTAASANTASAIVARDASGNFTAGTITAALTGAASSNVLKAGDTMTGVLAVTAGTAALPAITPSGDPNTGIFSPGADQLAISTSGTGKVFIDSSGNVALGGSTVQKSLTLNYANAAIGLSAASSGTYSSQGIFFYVDATAYSQIYNEGIGNLVFRNGSGLNERMRLDSSGRLGLGTSSPAVLAHLASTAAPTGQTNTPLRLTAGQTFGGEIAGYLNQGVNGGLILSTVDSGTATERIRITPTGVGIGTTSPTAELQFSNTIGTDGQANKIRFYVDGSNVYGFGLRTAGIDYRGDRHIFVKADGTTETARIDSSGRLLVGTSTALTTFFGTAVDKLAIGGGAAPQVIGCYAANEFASRLDFIKSRSATVNGQTIVQSGDTLAEIYFGGSDGTAPIPAARIFVQVDGTPGTNDMPGRLVFSTTADGGSSPTEALRITNDRVIAYNQPTPTSKSAAATLTITELKTSIIQYTGAVATLTLPTGTLMEGGFSGIYTNMAFEWSVINTGAGICTVAAGTDHTVVGSGAVAISESARFVSRRTAANTFVSYRVS